MSSLSCYRPGKARSVVLGISLAMLSFQALGFSLDDISARAGKLAGKSYAAPKSNLPAALRDMKFADYQQIHFREDKAWWADRKTPFQLYFFHQGMHFDLPVKINEITATGVKEITYDPASFDFGNLKVDPADLGNLGFAGFRVLYPLNSSDKRDEVATFLGASYFRVVGKNQVFGLSARGLAIDTAVPSGEEFPRFREFWVERPQADRRNLIVYALLDSPRATGAYRMVITPGEESVVDVEARIYLREHVTKLGIAPLTSMFLFGPHQPAREMNFRPALHDSNGLAIHAGNGEQIWRPLNNPARLSVSTYRIESPKGFGLLQRGHAFSQYEDLDERYDRRPSGWVEILGDWGKGQIELVEIPTPDETNDNIVTFWSPEKLPEPGQPLEISYRLHFTTDEASLAGPDSSWVSQTRRSAGDVKQQNLTRQPDGSTAFIIDFEGPSLASLPADAPVTPQVSVDDNAELVENSIRYNPVIKGWRLTLRVKPKDTGKPVEMRAALVNGDQTLSETWSYQLPAYE